MIRAATISLMLILLLVQGAFGFCSYAHGSNVSARARQLLACPACCERCAPSVPSDPTPTPSQPKATCHGFCTYLKADTVGIETHDVVHFALAASSVNASQPNRALLPAHQSTDSRAHPIAVRLHVLYGIILI